MSRSKKYTGYPLTEIKPGGKSKSRRSLAAEAPIALTYNGVSHVVMMATPADLTEFVTGFSLSEEIIAAPDEILSLEIEDLEDGYLARVEIPKEKFEGLLKRDRKLVGQTGCGLCGISELEDAVRAYPPVKTKPKANKQAVFRALKGIENLQPLNRETGAVHGAAFVRPDGKIAAVFEDVGRHNAFDKLIGHMALEKLSPRDGFVLLTSRCSFELVQKALSISLPMLVTISAATDLATQLARDHNLTLVSLARHDSMLAVNDPFDLFL